MKNNLTQYADKNQLDLYKRALEEALKRKVEETYIYSTYLDKLIEVK